MAEDESRLRGFQDGLFRDLESKLLARSGPQNLKLCDVSSSPQHPEPQTLTYKAPTKPSQPTTPLKTLEL